MEIILPIAIIGATLCLIYSSVSIIDMIWLTKKKVDEILEELKKGKP